MKTKTLLILWIAFLSFERGNSQSLFMEASPEIEEKVEKLLQQMTLAEKIGQLNQSNANGVATGPQKAQDDFYKQLEAGRIGSILNIAGVEEIRKYQEIAVTRSRLKIPLLFGYDVIHGYKTIFPIPLAESCSWDLELMEKSARIAAKEAAAAGLHWTFAPMIDVSRDPRWGRVLEGAGEDTWLTSRVAEAKVRGYQWNLGSNESVLACAKHFAAYGLPQAGKDYGTVDISERTLEEIYLPPFKAAVEAGVATFMPAFNDIAGVPCTANKWLLTEVLRNRWKFKGVVVSDWGAIWQLVPHGMAHGSTACSTVSRPCAGEIPVPSPGTARAPRPGAWSGSRPSCLPRPPRRKPSPAWRAFSPTAGFPDIYCPPLVEGQCPSATSRHAGLRKIPVCRGIEPDHSVPYPSSLSLSALKSNSSSTA